jgi:choline dehydrogenase-like flavoprotein
MPFDFRNSESPIPDNCSNCGVLNVETRAFVTEIHYEGRRATGVTYKKNGKLHTQSQKHVFLRLSFYASSLDVNMLLKLTFGDHDALDYRTVQNLLV